MEDLKVCTHRPTMKYNCVLEKPGVGRAKIPLCRLPPLEFTYGCPCPDLGDTAKEALFNWYRIDRDKKIKKDRGLQDEKKFRTDLKKYRYDRLKLNKVPDITFGDSSGIAEDMTAVMCHGYQHMLVENMKQKEAARREKILQKEERLASRRRTILRLKPKETQEEPLKLWKMKKFANVKAKVSTWRDRN